MLETAEGAMGMPGPDEAQHSAHPRASSGRPGLALALLLFALAGGVAAFLLLVVSPWAGAAGGCGGG
jgi:ferric-dicitrate binding protein FerR (iron transport regulator)